ncbi:MAG TPA: aminotransferase class I/II-fold pyridoxal phosphate-dependent enzyme [candidate division Zixibacteria bacterium]
MERKISTRLKNLGEYVFFSVAEAKKKAVQSGKDIIDLGGGNPDLAPHPKIIEALKREADVPENHRHPLYQGIPELRKAASDWMKRRFGVDVDPESEIFILLGSKEGLAHVSWAFIDPGDVALIPDPAYPAYERGAVLAGGKVVLMPLLKGNSWLPDFSKITKKDLSKAKLLFLNYPNNPTGALADEDFLKKAVDFAKKNELVVCQDMAYSEITFDNTKSSSIFQIEGAKDNCLEFFSFSKTYGMTGWRLGFVVGNSKLIDALKQVEISVNSGVFHVLQKAAVTALSLEEQDINQVRLTYQGRRDILVEGLKALGWEVEKPRGSIFVWASPVGAKFAHDLDSRQISNLLIEQTGIVTTPGVGLGPSGEGYLRFSLIANEERLKEAVQRIKSLHM